MNGNRWLDRLSQHERLNFLLTNRIPRRYATLFMGQVERDFVVARDLFQALDVVAHDRVERPEHWTELVDTPRAGRDALFIHVIAEEVHAVRAETS